MTDFPWRVFLFYLALPSLGAWAQHAVSGPDRVELAKLLPAVAVRPVDFLVDVQPILREHCFECHAGDVEEGGLNLAVKERVMEGGEHGAVLVPGESVASSLVHLVSGVDKDRFMPPEDNEPLTADQIGVLRAWIDQGANWPQGADVLDPRLERAREHWAFQRLDKIDPPTKRDGDAWSRTEIDVFIAAKLVASELSPSAPATATTLVRRLYFDLLGLPPTPDQTDRFVAAHQADSIVATTELIDQLLSSQHYGERWARH